MAFDQSSRPICLNYGCNRPVTRSTERWRPFCYKCHRAGYGAAKYELGVTPFKTGKCSNQDGRLGFKCPIDYTKAVWAIGQTQIDHISGDHLDNDPDNCMELCDMCHSYKGKLAGDFKRRGVYTYNKTKQPSVGIFAHV